MRLTFVLPALLAAPAAAQIPSENLDQLDRTVAVFLGGTVDDAGRLAAPADRRVRLPRCPEAVAIDPPALGAVAVRCASLGWRLRLAVTQTHATEGEVLIRRGDEVELAYRGSGFDVRTSATALEDGRMGGIVRVKPSTGASALTVRVRGPGEVAMGD